MSKKWRLRAAAGRILLRFGTPEYLSRGGLIMPERSRRKAEIGIVEDIGAPLSEDHEKILKDIKRGDSLPVTYGAGIEYYFGDAPEMAHLNGLRIFTIGEIGTFLEEENE